MPPQNAPTQPSTAVILEQIRNVAEDVRELKEDFKAEAQATVQFRENYIKGHEEALSLGKSAHERLDEHDAIIKEIKATLDRMDRALIPLTLSNAIMKVLGGAALLAVIALIFDIITHRVTLGF